MGTFGGMRRLVLATTSSCPITFIIFAPRKRCAADGGMDADVEER
jgi:hypothetical protein